MQKAAQGEVRYQSPDQRWGLREPGDQSKDGKKCPDSKQLREVELLV